MLLPILLAISAFLLQRSYPIPIPLIRRLFGSSVDILDNVVLFDAPAFQDSSGDWTAAMPAFVSLREVSLEPVAAAFTYVLSDLGIVVGDRVDVLADRLELFAAIGLSGKEVDVTVNGCSGGQVSLSQTSGQPDVGQMLKMVALGTCETGQPLVGNVQLAALDNRHFSATIFPSAPNGFGVISGPLPFYLTV
jgi:hypothetical protein